MFENQRTKPPWAPYPTSYRPEATATVAKWILNGESGSIIGLPGIGRSTFLNIVCNRPHALAPYFPQSAPTIVILPIDLNILPDASMATFYRVLLRAFYEGRHKFSPLLHEMLLDLYQTHAATTDPFLAQSVLLRLLRLLENELVRVVWVLNHFGQFCDTFATVEMTRTLRSLRDTHKNTVVYLTGMEKGFDYFSEPSIVEPLRDLLDSNVHWLKPLNEDNSHYIIEYHLRTASTLPETADIRQIYHISGGYPALIRVACQWWSTNEKKPDSSKWIDVLLELPDMRYRLEKIWYSLTQSEQFALSKLKALPTWPYLPASTQYESELDKLDKKGLYKRTSEGGAVLGSLFSSFVSRLDDQGKGKIWLDATTGNLYQGDRMLIDLTKQESELLRFFIENPLAWHSHDDIIEGAWSEVDYKEGVTPQAVYQQIRGLRKKIEPVPSIPLYIVTKHGGYRFFPEGCPGN